MDNFPDARWWGVVVPLNELQVCLLKINHGQHRWTAKLEAETSAEWQTRSQRCVKISYTNPGFVDMPNAISYLFPAFVDTVFWQPEVLVCLHPSLAITAQRGLYFEEGELKFDLLGDWQRFWQIREVLASVAQSSCRD